MSANLTMIWNGGKEPSISKYFAVFSLCLCHHHHHDGNKEDYGSCQEISFPKCWPARPKYFQRQPLSRNIHNFRNISQKDIWAEIFTIFKKFLNISQKHIWAEIFRRLNYSWNCLKNIFTFPFTFIDFQSITSHSKATCVFLYRSKIYV